MISILKGINLHVILVGAFIILVLLFDLSEQVTTPYPNYCFLLVFLLSLPNIKKIKWTCFLSFSVFFVVWCGFTLWWSVDYSSSVSRYQTVILLLLLCFSFASLNERSDRTVKLLLLFFYIGSFLLMLQAFFSLGAYSLSVLRTSERLSTGLMEENFLGKILAIGSIVCLYYLITTSSKVVHVAAYIFYLYMGVVLKSKSTFLGMLVGGIFFLYNYFKEKRQIGKFVLVVLVLVIGGYFLSINGFFGDAFVRIINMTNFMQGDSEADMSTFERIGYIEIGWNDFLDSPILGYGIGSASKLTGGTYFHNNYIQLLAETGIVGFLLYYSVLVWLIVETWTYRNNHEGILFLAIVFTMLIGDTSNTTYYQKLTWILYSLNYLWICSKKNNKIISK